MRVLRWCDHFTRLRVLDHDRRRAWLHRGDRATNWGGILDSGMILTVGGVCVVCVVGGFVGGYWVLGIGGGGGWCGILDLGMI